MSVQLYGPNNEPRIAFDIGRGESSLYDAALDGLWRGLKQRVLRIESELRDLGVTP
jgi:hypothetical protein